MTPILERAFELARTGRYRRVQEIRDRLRQEGYQNANYVLAGPSLTAQLRQLCAQSVEAEAPMTD